MKSFVLLLAVLTTASAVSVIDSLFDFNGNYSGLEFSDKGCKCKNGRCVTDNKGKTKCACKSGYALQDEETCEVCDCGTNGKCFFALQRSVDLSIRYEKKCLCDKGYASKDGVCVVCVCGENSKCEFENGEKNCYCIDGYAEKDGVCTACDCGEFGECTFVNGQKKCECAQDYLVNNGKCEECYCGEHGTCSFQNGRKTCDCQAGYKEKEGTCERCDCGTQGIDCRFAGKEKICRCTEGYSQKHGLCEDCACGPASSGCVFRDDRKSCKCKNGYVQKGATCEMGCGVYRNCDNGGNCEYGFCKCLPGTRGEFCEIIEGCQNLCPNTRDSVCTYDVSRQQAYCKCNNQGLQYDSLTQKCKRSCDQTQCRNGGKCDKSGGTGFCRCMPGTSGDLCEVVDECAKTAFCGEGATCYFDVAKGRAACNCANPKLSYDERERKCKRTCSDDNKRCENGGECVSIGDFTFCKCPDGTSGDMCEVVDDCVTKRLECGADAACVFDVSRRTASCACIDSNKAYDPTTATCKITCDDTRRCENGGSCSGAGGNFCNCIDGTSGDLCEIIEDCRKGLCGFDQSVKCTFDIQNKVGVCGCQDPSQKYDPTSKVCKHCDCGKSAITCDFVNGNKVCSCPEAYADNNGRCEKTRCIENKCTNGKCVIVRGEEEVCRCYEGFVLEGGNFCRRVDCKNTICHRGTCVVRHGNKEECICPAGHIYHRSQCMKGQCTVATCFGGRCETLGDERVCVCPDGYSVKGIGCFATVCEQQPCFGGWCHVEDNKEICTCHEGYELIGNVCRLKFLCKTKKCYGGMCNVVDNEEVCTCPPGHFLHEDVCRRMGF